MLFPLPDRDFGVIEVAVPWTLLVEAGHEVVFATALSGRRPGDAYLIAKRLLAKL